MSQDVLNDGKIVCQIDNARVHSIQMHIRDNHADWTVERYQSEFPDAPLLSDFAKQRLAQRAAEKRKKAEESAPMSASRKAYLHDVFGLGNAGLSTHGTPLEITLVDDRSEMSMPWIPEVDENYVFQPDLLKKVIAGLELNFTTYLWGFHGTGKTTILEQVHARTKRPFIRVQHTINTEEGHILGQYVVRTKPVAEEVIDTMGNKVTVMKNATVTEFEPGPLPLAMKHGWTYCADEYDYAMPSVSAVYQPVLEGKALVIKEAPAEWRVVRPHPNFRFQATGNTNGVGDETGLYQGTVIQNAANYSRFKLTEEVQYMEPKVEELVVMQQTAIEKSDAVKLVHFANQIRNSFRDGKISMTISPRELIGAAQLAMTFGANWQMGIKLAFANRLSRIDKKVVEELAQRIWGA